MGDRLATIYMGRKHGAALPFMWEMGPLLAQCGMGRCLYLRTNLNLNLNDVD